MSIAYRLFRCKGQVVFLKKKGISVWVGLITIQNEKVPVHSVAMQLLDKHATNTAYSSRGVVRGQGAAEFFITCVWTPDG